MSREELIDKISGDIMSSVQAPPSVDSPSSPIILAFQRVYAYCPKCVTDYVTFDDIMEGMMSGKGVSLCVRIEDAYGDALDRGAQITNRESLALREVLQLIRKLQP
jgi:hypothetical protein